MMSKGHGHGRGEPPNSQNGMFYVMSRTPIIPTFNKKKTSKDKIAKNSKFLIDSIV